MSAGGQLAAVYRSTLETIDAPCRCETLQPTQLEAAATLPFGPGGGKRTSQRRNVATHAAIRCAYFWCIAILMLLFVNGSRAELPVTDRRGLLSLVGRVAAEVVLNTASG